MWSTAKEITAGDVVIVWLTRDAIQPLVIVPGKELNGRFGVYRHDDLIGIPYGSKVPSRNGRGYIHVLRPTPELWTLALPHRTQILYHADIAFVSSWLALKPGSLMIEAGLEFAAHGMDKFVTLSHRNVCKDGFGLKDAVDAVFLDLPAPWDAVGHAKVALKKDQIGRICCFSPCIEQVLRTVTALNEAGFTGITMYETLLRPQEVSTVQLPTIDQAVQKLKDAEVQAERRRLKQIANSREKEREKFLKRKRDANGLLVPDGAGPSCSNEGDQLINDDPSTGANKKRKELHDLDAVSMMEEGEIGDPARPEEGDGANNEAGPVTTATGSADAKLADQHQRSETDTPASITPSIHAAHPFVEVRGHTSYLTFALLLPYQRLVESLASTQTEPPQVPAPPPEPPTAGNDNTQETTTTMTHDDFDNFLQSIPEALAFHCLAKWLKL
ncbi:hypothetical protein BS47DRAFT_1378142 [Hydnum rufescens UP504]|uniref:tRNA (adenine(58)-N(1))-methyltransferase catalytic subunit TRM61 n=1 Tax=Hydnum rufescens UP504 TaxID=1448309 RepID=A0A9P6DKM4_9AGAM|nr:hypothetical protein BS47DRAFT_1378142 [Hydnum rufescens UP504]